MTKRLHCGDDGPHTWFPNCTFNGPVTVNVGHDADTMEEELEMQGGEGGKGCPITNKGVGPFTSKAPLKPLRSVCFLTGAKSPTLPNTGVVDGAMEVDGQDDDEEDEEDEEEEDEDEGIIDVGVEGVFPPHDEGGVPAQSGPAPPPNPEPMPEPSPEPAPDPVPVPGPGPEPPVQPTASPAKPGSPLGGPTPPATPTHA